MAESKLQRLEIRQRLGLMEDDFLLTIFGDYNSCDQRMGDQVDRFADGIYETLKEKFNASSNWSLIVLGRNGTARENMVFSDEAEAELLTYLSAADLHACSLARLPDPVNNEN